MRPGEPLEPLLEQAARAITATADERSEFIVDHLCLSSVQVSDTDHEGSDMSALGYHPPDARLQVSAQLPSRERIHLAGSARSGSIASSAAPSNDASTPSPDGTIRTSRRGAASARRSSSASTVGRHERMDPLEQPAEHDEPWDRAD